MVLVTVEFDPVLNLSEKWKFVRKSRISITMALFYEATDNSGDAVLVKDPHFTLALHGVSIRLDHGGSSVLIPSGARIFSQFPFDAKNISCSTKTKENQR